MTGRQGDANLSVASTWTRECGIDVVSHASRERKDLRIPQAALVVSLLSELAEVQRFRQRVLKADSTVRIGGRCEFFDCRLAHDGDDERCNRTVDRFHVADINGVILPQAQQRIDIRMKNVRGGKWLERRPLAFPLRPEPVCNSRQVARRRRILKMRGEQTKAPFENLRRTSRPCEGKKRGGNPTLRCPSGMQEFRLCSIDPTFE